MKHVTYDKKTTVQKGFKTNDINKFVLALIRDTQYCQVETNCFRFNVGGALWTDYTLFELRYVFNMYELKQLNVLCVQSDTTYTVEKQLP